MTYISIPEQRGLSPTHSLSLCLPLYLLCCRLFLSKTQKKIVGPPLYIRVIEFSKFVELYREVVVLHLTVVQQRLKTKTNQTLARFKAHVYFSYNHRTNLGGTGAFRHGGGTN